MTALYKYFLALPAVLLICLAAYAQQGGDEVEEDLRRAGIFHRNYQFGKAVEYYSEALGKTADTTLRLEIMERIVECQNGQSMMQYIVRPDEITSGIFRINEFFLYINEFSDNSWILRSRRIRSMESLHFQSQGQRRMDCPGPAEREHPLQRQ